MREDTSLGFLPRAAGPREPAGHGSAQEVPDEGLSLIAAAAARPPEAVVGLIRPTCALGR
ncbi:hypothetical protein [Streptomyces mirabilis]|uniref:hypothetical protein n=1 Tax=Streptomyces mirabilis TaxID=68239 RepID=UPI0033BD96E4